MVFRIHIFVLLFCLCAYALLASPSQELKPLAPCKEALDVVYQYFKKEIEGDYQIGSAEQNFQWLSRNLLLGPEVTFTNEIVEELPNDSLEFVEPVELHFGRMTPAVKAHIREVAQRLSFMTPKITDELIRFLEEVIRPRSLVLVMKNIDEEREGFRVFSSVDERSLDVPVHVGQLNLYLEAVDDVGNWYSINIEPGSFEVNRAPVRFGQLEQRWASIFERAENAGFTGYLHRGHGGGGGHLHLGFSSREKNLFFQHPILLRNLLSLPLTYPSIFYFLADHRDYGIDSTSASPLDDGVYYRSLPDTHPETEKAKIFFDSLLGAEIIWRDQPITESRLIELRDKISVHEQHDYYISLDRFLGDEHPSANDPNRLETVEIRLGRSFNTYEDLESYSLFWFRWMEFFMNHPNHTFDFDSFEHPMYPSAADHSSEFGQLNAVSAQRGRLHNYGGDRPTIEIETKVYGKSDAKNWRILKIPDLHDANPSYEIVIPESWKSEEDSTLYFNGLKLVRDDDKMPSPRSGLPADTSNFVLIAEVNSEGEILKQTAIVFLDYDDNDLKWAEIYSNSSRLTPDASYIQNLLWVGSDIDHGILARQLNYQFEDSHALIAKYLAELALAAENQADIR